MAGISGNLGLVQDVRLIDGFIPLDIEEKSDATWDPTMLINEIFSDVRPCPGYAKKTISDMASRNEEVVPMSGLIEKLPSNADKPSLLKSWKKRFVRCQNCNLFYYEDNKSTRALGIIKLVGAKVTISADHTFRVVEKESSTLYTFRCATQAFAEDWVAAIRRETDKADVVRQEVENSVSTVIMDVGSSTTRAGFVYDNAYPCVCFPSVMAYNRETKDKSAAIYGKDSLLPSVREKSVLRYPLRSSLTVKKFGVEVNEIVGLIKHAFDALEAKPSEFKLILTLPQCVQEKEKVELLNIIFEDLHCPAVYLSEQAIMALYSYHMTSGVVVDIGDRMDIVPVVDGVIVENGVSRYPYGGRAVNEAMTRLLAEEGYRMFADVQQYVVKYIKERAAYVADNKSEQEDRCSLNPGEWTETVDCRRFRLPSGILSVKVLESRFKATEGFFDPNVFGYDNVGIHHLVEKAIKAAGIDNRRELCRNILLSGGSTQTRGLPKRLQSEVATLMPAGSQVQVHAHDDRHYAAFKGAAVLASLEMFDSICIWSQDWLAHEHEDRRSMLSRWQ